MRKQKSLQRLFLSIPASPVTGFPQLKVAPVSGEMQVFPAVRKQQPWHCLAFKPLLRQVREKSAV